jgi:hypothetical protein
MAVVQHVWIFFTAQNTSPLTRFMNRVLYCGRRFPLARPWREVLPLFAFIEQP